MVSGPAPSSSPATSGVGKTVAVIGAGIVGLATAIEIQRAGHAVVVIEPGEPGGRQAASYGNGTWLNPGGIMPMSVPGLWRKVPGYLIDPDGPFIIRWRHLPALAPWLLRFLAAGSSWDKVEACARIRIDLCRQANDDHAALAAEAGVPDLMRREGLMCVYRDRADFLGESFEWRLRREFGVAFREIGEAELREREPAVGPDYHFAALIEGGGNIADPGAYCAALANLLAARGASFRRTEATDFDIGPDGRLRAVLTTDGPIACDRAIIAAGARSTALARAAGDRVPLVSERGYHVVIADSGIAPRSALMFQDTKVAVAATPAGLRLAGQVELASLAADPDWRRADILTRLAPRMLPGLAGRITPATTDRWLGHRPSTPDGLPCIGPSRASSDIVHAFGHGHSGLLQAPATARIVAALVDGRPSPIEPAPFSARRF